MLFLRPEVVSKDLVDRPRAGRGEGHQGQTSLAAGFAAGGSVPPHSAVVELWAVGVGISQASGELGPCLPDGIGPAMSRLASLG